MPTQCYFDTILVPLPTWLLIALLLIFSLALRAPLDAKAKRWTYKRRWHRVVHLVVYYFFIAVVLLMESVEVARLAQINFGLGLIPFVYVGCVIAAAGQATKGLGHRLRGWQVANAVFWAASLAVSVAKVAALNALPRDEAYRREEGPYGVSHQVTDLTILIAFYALLFVYEIALLFSTPWSESVGHQPAGQLEQKV